MDLTYERQPNRFNVTDISQNNITFDLVQKRKFNADSMPRHKKKGGDIKCDEIKLNRNS